MWTFPTSIQRSSFRICRWLPGGCSPQRRGRPAHRTDMTRPTQLLLCLILLAATAACKDRTSATTARVSGQVEATEVHVAPEVGGRLLEIPINEGDRVKAGEVIARIDTRDV